MPLPSWGHVPRRRVWLWVGFVCLWIFIATVGFHPFDVSQAQSSNVLARSSRALLSNTVPLWRRGRQDYDARSGQSYLRGKPQMYRRPSQATHRCHRKSASFWCKLICCQPLVQTGQSIVSSRPNTPPLSPLAPHLSPVHLSPVHGRSVARVSLGVSASASSTSSMQPSPRPKATPTTLRQYIENLKGRPSSSSDNSVTQHESQSLAYLLSEHRARSMRLSPNNNLAPGENVDEIEGEERPKLKEDELLKLQKAASDLVTDVKQSSLSRPVRKSPASTSQTGRPSKAPHLGRSHPSNEPNSSKEPVMEHVSEGNEDTITDEEEPQHLYSRTLHNGRKNLFDNAEGSSYGFSRKNYLYAPRARNSILKKCVSSCPKFAESCCPSLAKILKVLNLGAFKKDASAPMQRPLQIPGAREPGFSRGRMEVYSGKGKGPYIVEASKQKTTSPKTLKWPKLTWLEKSNYPAYRIRTNAPDVVREGDYVGKSDHIVTPLQRKTRPDSTSEASTSKGLYSHERYLRWKNSADRLDLLDQYERGDPLIQKGFIGAVHDAPFGNMGMSTQHDASSRSKIDSHYDFSRSSTSSSASDYDDDALSSAFGMRDKANSKHEKRSFEARMSRHVTDNEGLTKRADTGQLKAAKGGASTPSHSQSAEQAQTDEQTLRELMREFPDAMKFQMEKLESEANIRRKQKSSVSRKKVLDNSVQELRMPKDKKVFEQVEKEFPEAIEWQYQKMKARKSQFSPAALHSAQSTQSESGAELLRKEPLVQSSVRRLFREFELRGVPLTEQDKMRMRNYIALEENADRAWAKQKLRLGENQIFEDHRGSLHGADTASQRSNRPVKISSSSDRPASRSAQQAQKKADPQKDITPADEKKKVKIVESDSPGPALYDTHAGKVSPDTRKEAEKISAMLFQKRGNVPVGGNGNTGTVKSKEKNDRFAQALSKWIYRHGRKRKVIKVENEFASFYAPRQLKDANGGSTKPPFYLRKAQRPWWHRMTGGLMGKSKPTRSTSSPKATDELLSPTQSIMSFASSQEPSETAPLRGADALKSLIEHRRLYKNSRRTKFSSSGRTLPLPPPPGDPEREVFMAIKKKAKDVLPEAKELERQESLRRTNSEPLNASAAKLATSSRTSRKQGPPNIYETPSPLRYQGRVKKSKSRSRDQRQESRIVRLGNKKQPAMLSQVWRSVQKPLMNCINPETCRTLERDAVVNYPPLRPRLRQSLAAPTRQRTLAIQAAPGTP